MPKVRRLGVVANKQLGFEETMLDEVGGKKTERVELSRRVDY
jgi:hypothetical protein